MDKALTVLGRTFIGAGLLVFAFVAYQLWGTNITEARYQNRLQAEAERAFLTSDGGGGDPSTDGPPTTQNGGSTTAAPPNTTPAPPPAPAGSAVAVISIPKLGLQKAVVEGTNVDDLKRGPGHYEGTPLPGQPGNAAIAGHRTTYGAPFGALDDLVAGDEIRVSTRQGSFRYLVSKKSVVSPESVEVLNQTRDNRLTLTTCHPRYSAAQRLIIVATLDNRPAPAAPTTTAPPSTTTPPTTLRGAPPTQPPLAALPATNLDGATLSGTSVDKTPVVIWALLVLIVGLAVYIASRAWNRWLAYLIGAPIFLVVLFIFFENFSRLLPANA